MRIRGPRRAICMRIVVSNERSPKWTRERRLRVALANNNRGDWYVAKAQRTVADLERRFAEGSVGSLLYEVVGGILGDHRKLASGEGGHYLYVQLSRFDGDVRLCLSELDVDVLGCVAFSQIRHP